MSSVKENRFTQPGSPASPSRKKSIPKPLTARPLSNFLLKTESSADMKVIEKYRVRDAKDLTGSSANLMARNYGSSANVLAKTISTSQLAPTFSQPALHNKRQQMSMMFWFSFCMHVYERSVRLKYKIQDLSQLRMTNSKLRQELLEATSEFEATKLKLDACKSSKKVLKNKIARIEADHNAAETALRDEVSQVTEKLQRLQSEHEEVDRKMREKESQERLSLIVKHQEESGMVRQGYEVQLAMRDASIEELREALEKERSVAQDAERHIASLKATVADLRKRDHERAKELDDMKRERELLVAQHAAHTGEVMAQLEFYKKEYARRKNI